MRNLLFILLCLVLTAPTAFALSYSDTDMAVIGNGKGIYGYNASGVPKQLIGINSSNAVVINSGALALRISGLVTLSGASTTMTSAISQSPTLNIINTNADAYGSYIDFKKLSASPVTSDVIATQRFYSYDASANSTLMAAIVVSCADVSSSNEDAIIDLQAMKEGTLTSILKITSGNISMDVPTGDATLTTGNINISIVIGGVTYYIKANTEQ